MPSDTPTAKPSAEAAQRAHEWFARILARGERAILDDAWRKREATEGPAATSQEMRPSS
jgi:hypothetical protein